MPIIAWIKKHSFSVWAFMIWLILCVPQNMVTLVMYYYQDFQDSPDTRNYTCYDFHTFNNWDIVQLKGTIIVAIACCGIIGNLFSVVVLQRLASKSGFNKLLLALGTQLVYTSQIDFWDLTLRDFFLHFFYFLAVMDLIFLVMLIVSDGFCFGIFIYGRPLWLDIIYPFGIHPMFFMFRFCTTYMLVAISIERYIALSNLIGYKSRCNSYIRLVVLYSSEFPKGPSLYYISTFLDIF